MINQEKDDAISLQITRERQREREKEGPGDQKVDEQKCDKYHLLSFQDKLHQQLLRKLTTLEMEPLPAITQKKEKKKRSPVSINKHPIEIVIKIESFCPRISKV